MTTINPNTPTIPNAIELDAVINTLQLALAADLPWLQKSFHRARLFNGETGFKPKCYQGSQEYFEVLHNDTLSAHSFFYVTGPHVVNDDGYDAGQFGYYNVPTSLFVLGDLRKIDASKNYIYTEELKADVLDVIRDDQNAAVVSVLDDDSNAIFQEFQINDQGRELLMYPKFALRFNLTLTYQENCIIV